MRSLKSTPDHQDDEERRIAEWRSKRLGLDQDQPAAETSPSVQDDEQSLIDAWREKQTTARSGRVEAMTVDTVLQPADAKDKPDSRLEEETSAAVSHDLDAFEGTRSPVHGFKMPPRQAPSQIEHSDASRPALAKGASPSPHVRQDPSKINVSKQALDSQQQRKDAISRDKLQAEVDKLDDAEADLPSYDDVEDIFQHLKAAQRRQSVGFLARFLAIVLVPTFCVWYYVSYVSVPLYKASAVISVTKPAPDANSGALGILGAVGNTGQMRDAFMVLEFLQSPAVLEDLEQDIGLISYYSGPEMDVVGRVRNLDILQLTEAQMLGRYIKSSINIQNGLISIGVHARSEDDALVFLNALLERAEQHMNMLSSAMFDERMAQANAAVDRAQAAVQETQRDFIAVQIRNGELEPQAAIAGIYDAIGRLEAEKLEIDRRIYALETAGQADSPIMPQYRTSQSELIQLIELQRQRLVDASSGLSLNEKLVDHELARSAILVSEQALAAALMARNEALKAAELGVSRFQTVVPPQAPKIATYPNRFQMTLLAFSIFLALLAVVSIALPKKD